MWEAGGIRHADAEALADDGGEVRELLDVEFGGAGGGGGVGVGYDLFA